MSRNDLEVAEADYALFARIVRETQDERDRFRVALERIADDPFDRSASEIARAALDRHPLGRDEHGGQFTGEAP